MEWSFPALTCLFPFAASEVQAQGFNNPENLTIVTSTAIVVIVILCLALYARKGTGLIPSGLGAIFEHVYDFVDDMATSMIGKRGRRYVPFAMSIFLFVLICNWSSLIPMPKFASGVSCDIEPVTGRYAASKEQRQLDEKLDEPLAPYEAPSVSFNTTLALAVVSFLAFNFYGLRQSVCGDPGATKHSLPAVAGEDQSSEPNEPGHGIFVGFFHWLSHFLSPTTSLWHELDGVLRWVLVPLLGCLFVVLNVVEEVARLVSLSIRLYGNLYGEHQVKTNLISTCRDFLDKASQNFSSEFMTGVGYCLMALLLWGSSFFVTCIGTLDGFIQAFIFFVLTLSYISHVVCHEE